MLTTLRYYEWRKNRKKIVFIAATICACLTMFMAIDVLVVTIERSIAEEVKPIVGGDIVIRNSSDLSSQQRDRLDQILQQYDAQRTTKIEFFTNMEDKEGKQILVEVIAIDQAYPFYGKFIYMPLSGEIVGDRVLVDDIVLQQHVVDGSLRLGSKQVVVNGRIEQFPENSFSFFTDGRKIIVDKEILSGTNLTDIGSRVSYEYLIKVPRLEDVEKLADLLREEDMFVGLQVRDYNQTIGQVGSLTDDFYTYLYMIVVMTFALAGLSIFFMVETYVIEEGKRFGIMKILGLKNMALLRMLGIGSIGMYIVSFICAVGLVQFVHFLQPYLPLQQEIIFSADIYARAALVGLLIMSMSLGFPLVTFIYKHPLECIKVTVFSPKTRRQKNIQLCVIWLMIVLMLYIAAANFIQALVFGTIGVAIALVIGGIIYSLLVWIFRIAKVIRKKYFLRYDVIRSMVRPGSMSLISIGALWVVTSILFTLVAVFYSFDQRLYIANTQQPNLFIVNLKSEDISKLSGYTQDQFFSVILGRIISINGVALRDHLQGSSSNEFTREFNITTNVLVDDSIVEGKKSVGVNEVSVADDFARRLNVEIGDKIEFFIAGRNFVLTIVSERKIQTDGTRPFFYFQLSQEQFSQAPKTYFIPVRIQTGELETYKADLVKTIGPHLSFIDISAISDTIKQVSSDIRTAVTLLCIVILLFIAGVMFATNIRMRQYKAYKLGLYQLLGATYYQQHRLSMYEYVYQACFACVRSCITGIAITIAIIQNARILQVYTLGMVYGAGVVILIYLMQVVFLYIAGIVSVKEKYMRG